MKKLRYHIELLYSADNIADNRKSDKFERLNEGGDLTTSVLKHFDVPFIVTLAYDFYHSEPVLIKAVKYDKHGNGYTLYSEWGGFGSIEGEYPVLSMLESLGVIPCSIDEAIKIVEGKK